MEGKENAIVVQESKRLVARSIKERFDGNIYREIAELVTNSLDSYNRILNYKGNKIVRIELHKPQRKNYEKNTLRVIDYAEGMSLDTMIKIFAVRGEDNNQGASFKNVRGMFGLGASDVMRISAYQDKSAEYYSFLNGEVSCLRFKMNDDKTQTTIIPSNIKDNNQIIGLRQKYGIENNGTVAIFGIPDEVNMPSNFNEFQKGLESLFLLRNILMDETNEIILMAYDTTDRLSTNKEEYKLGELFYEKDFSFEYKKERFDSNLKFYFNNNKSINKLEIIVQDGRNVIYDNQPQMFGFKKSQGAELISGILTIKNFYEEQNYFLNNKDLSLLNDDRSGFDINKGFGKTLTTTLEPYISEAISIASKDLKKENTSLSSTKNYREFLSFLNKDLKSTQVIGRGNSKDPRLPPVDAIEFVRPKIMITSGRKYDLKIDINKNLVQPNDEIIIKSYGNDLNYINHSATLRITESDLKEEIPQKSVLIEGIKQSTNNILLTATINNTTTRCDISVVNEEIVYPKNGIEFEKHDMIITPDVNHKKIKLYYDTSAIGTNQIIVSDNSSGKLSFQKHLFDLKDGIFLTDTIGYFLLTFSGGELNDEYKIIATCSNCSDVLNADVLETSSQEHSNRGDIADYELCDDEYVGQSFYDPRDHKIKILTKNSINNQFVKEWKPNLSGKELLYIISLVCYETAKLYTDKEKRNGHINENDIEDYLNRLTIKKDEYFTKFLNLTDSKKQ